MFENTYDIFNKSRNVIRCKDITKTPPCHLTLAKPKSWF